MDRKFVERELTPAGPRRRGTPEAGARSVTVNLGESPLGWLHARGHLSDRQFDAGERLRADYECAQLAPSVTMRWDPVRVDGGGGADCLTPGERQIAARERFDGAMAQAGRGLSDILWRAACAGKASRRLKRRLPGPPAAASWCSASRSTGSPISTG